MLSNRLLCVTLRDFCNIDEQYNDCQFGAQLELVYILTPRSNMFGCSPGMFFLPPRWSFASHMRKPNYVFFLSPFQFRANESCILLHLRLEMSCDRVRFIGMWHEFKAG